MGAMDTHFLRPELAGPLTGCCMALGSFVIIVTLIQEETQLALPRLPTQLTTPVRRWEGESPQSAVERSDEQGGGEVPARLLPSWK